MKLTYGSKFGIKTIDSNTYTTSQEKEFLLLLIHIEDKDQLIDECLNILGISYEMMSTLSELEKRYILLKARELSLGEDINFKYACKKCNSVNMSIIKTSELFTNKYKEYNGDVIIDGLTINEQFKDVDKLTEADIIEYISTKFDYDSLSSKTFDTINYEIILNGMKMHNYFSHECGCKHITQVNITDDFIVENMSEDTLPSLYKLYSSLIYHGNYSKQDIDSMYPFERSIFVGLLNDIKNPKPNQ